MNDQEWLVCMEPGPMLGLLWKRASDRKLRLFAVACCHRIWQLLLDERSRQAVNVAERHADGQATDKELETASGPACDVWDADMERASREGKWDELSEPPPYTPAAAAYNVAIPPGWWGGAPAFVAPYQITRELAPNSETEAAAQCELLREILCNPFRPVTISLTWLTPKVTALAQSIYDDRRFADMPVLADALEEAGCTDADILNHCRQPGEHVRGCWVVDLLLGKS